MDYRPQRDQLIEKFQSLIGESDPVRSILFEIVKQLSSDICELEDQLQEAQSKIQDLETYR